MSGLIFNEESLLTGNIFKYEQRMKSHVMKYLENGAILTTYWSINDNAVTVDRGMRDIEELFGKMSPLRYNKILNFPLYGFPGIVPVNNDELNIDDISVDGECIILPSTLIPYPNDFFLINHQEQSQVRAIFQVVEVTHDAMSREGYYKIRYRLHSTSDESLQNLERLTVATYHTELDAIGSNTNPIIKEDDYVRRGQIEQMVNQMISSYKAMFYNSKHNCFLFYNQDTGDRWFDLCGNEFMANHNLMNPTNSNQVIMLHKKIRDSQFPIYYNNSIYTWLELGAPKQQLQKFHFMLSPGEGYKDSSFFRWSDTDIQVIQPLATYQVGINNQEYSFFDHDQLEAFNQTRIPPTSEFDKLIWNYINNPNLISISDVSLNTANSLLSSIRHLDVFLYTPIIIFIIRKILRMN